MKIQNILAFPLFHLTTAPTLRESSLYNMIFNNKCEKGEAYPSFLLAKRRGGPKACLLVGGTLRDKGA